MAFFSPPSNVNFMGSRRISVAISIVLVIGSILALATRGLNFALDFTGGTLVEVNYDAPVEQPAVVKALEAAGFRGAVVQSFDSRTLAIRLAPAENAKEQADVPDAHDTNTTNHTAALGKRVGNGNASG